MSWVNLPQIVLFAIAGVFFYCLPDRRILPFQHPVLASTLIFGLYASQYTPPLYAMGYIGIRASDQHLLLQLLLVHFCNPLLLDQLVQTHPVPSHQGCPLFLLYHPTGQLSFWQASSCWPSVWWDRRILCPLSSGLTSGKAITAIVDGSADRHEQAYQERLELLLTPSDVCVLPGLLPPCPPFEDDLLAASEDDGEYWQNEALAEYFNHKKVVLDAAG